MYFKRSGLITACSCYISILYLCYAGSTTFLTLLQHAQSAPAGTGMIIFLITVLILYTGKDSLPLLGPDDKVTKSPQL